MPKKNRVYQKKSFESDGSKSDTTANIYMSMITSKAFKDLTPRQRLLYVYAKSRMYGQKTADKRRLFQQFDDYKEPANIDVYFSLSNYEVTEELGAYSKTNLMQFYRDMEALILHGFIKCVACGSTEHSKKRTIYTYSDKWQIWDTEQFAIEPSEMTLAMRKKHFHINKSNKHKRVMINKSNKHSAKIRDSN